MLKNECLFKKTAIFFCLCFSSFFHVNLFCNAQMNNVSNLYSKKITVIWGKAVEKYVSTGYYNKIY